MLTQILSYASLALMLGALVGGAYLAWRAHPAWVFSVGLVLSVFAGYWEQLGIPGVIAPDRLLLTIGVIAVLLRAPGDAARPPLYVHGVHWAIAFAGLFAVESALIAGTFFDRQDFLALLEHYALIAMAVFYVSQTAFREPRYRRIFLGGLVVLGGYLGVTALLETVGAHGVLWPGYIGDRDVGIHFGRARGPFAEAVTNGEALFACLVGSLVAYIVWRGRRARMAAAVVAALCAAGLLFTLQRSIWLATIVVACVMLLAARELREWFVPAIAAAIAGVLICFALIPGFAEEAAGRRKDDVTVYDRQNQARAAVNMINTRPILGFGWAEFARQSRDYYEMADDYPLVEGEYDVHNVYLRYGVELGLVGLALWAAAILAAVLTNVFGPAPPSMRPWQLALAAYALFYAVVSAFVPPQVFPTLVLWMLAGVVWAGRHGGEYAVASAATQQPGRPEPGGSPSPA